MHIMARKSPRIEVKINKLLDNFKLAKLIDELGSQTSTSMTWRGEPLQAAVYYLSDDVELRAHLGCDQLARAATVIDRAVGGSYTRRLYASLYVYCRTIVTGDRHSTVNIDKP